MSSLEGTSKFFRSSKLSSRGSEDSGIDGHGSTVSHCHSTGDNIHDDDAGDYYGAALVAAALRLKVTRSMLQSLEEEFRVAQVREALFVISSRQKDKSDSSGGGASNRVAGSNGGNGGMSSIGARQSGSVSPSPGGFGAPFAASARALGLNLSSSTGKKSNSSSASASRNGEGLFPGSPFRGNSNSSSSSSENKQNSGQNQSSLSASQFMSLPQRLGLQGSVSTVGKSLPSIIPGRRSTTVADIVAHHDPFSLPLVYEDKEGSLVVPRPVLESLALEIRRLEEVGARDAAHFTQRIGAAQVRKPAEPITWEHTKLLD